MIDAITITETRFGGDNDVAEYLKNARHCTDRRGVSYIGGYVGTMAVREYPDRIRIKGSIPRYAHGNNFTVTDRLTTANVVNELCDILHFDLTHGRIGYIELCATIGTKQQIPDYFPYMGKCGRLHRWISPQGSLYYKNQGKQSTREICIYDKRLDAIRKGLIIPNIPPNLMRFEVRYGRRLPQQLKIPELTASTLYDEDVWATLCERIWEDYKSIKKYNEIMSKEIKKPSDAVAEYYALRMQGSTATDVENYVEELKQRKVFSESKYYARTKAQLMRYLEMADGNPSPLVEELDEKIRDAVNEAKG
jgi:hypothetical protein